MGTQTQTDCAYILLSFLLSHLKLHLTIQWQVFGQGRTGFVQVQTARATGEILAIGFTAC